MAETGVSTPTLAEASMRFLASLPADSRPDYQAGVNRFVQWFGADRSLSQLRALDVESFADAALGSAASGRWLDPVHAFLSYANKEGLTTGNLSTNLRLRKPSASDRAAAAAASGNQIPLTPEGYQALIKELEDLKEQRPHIAEELRAAMADKDFRENSPLDAARERQALVEARIRELDQMLKVAVIVETSSGPSDMTHVGCRVQVRDLDSTDERNYTLVSPTEVNPREGKISIASPVGRALLDRAVGDEVEVMVPKGRIRLRIQAIEG
ncbi:MAG TPA: transcription elongation factor GreA [Dehalococcoidia bacterium]|nr:transcription elongation factor GreA [Dehalococcoidia bacterium]